MRMLALGLLLALTAGCGGGSRRPDAHTTRSSNAQSCRTLVRVLTRLPTPTTMRAQRRGLALLRATDRALRQRFSVQSRLAVEELSAALRAEHESISARLDGRVTASRRLHANAEARYASGVSLARTAGASCP